MNFTQFSKNGTSGKATVYKGQGQDPTRTLFASGLPNDITERDFYLLFHDFQGYEGAVIKRQPSSAEETVWYPKSPVAFLRFSTTDYARTVMHQFQSFPLDQKVPNYKLRLQFAKTNTRCRNKATYHNPIRNSLYLERQILESAIKQFTTTRLESVEFSNGSRQQN